MLDLIPMGNAIIVKRLIVTETKSGIIMPSKDSIPLSEGRVLRTGPSVQRTKEGDLVLFGKNNGTDIERGNETFTVLYEASIAAKIDETKQVDDNLVKKEI